VIMVRAVLFRWFDDILWARMGNDCIGGVYLLGKR
jgi:hypothetical protein